VSESGPRAFEPRSGDERIAALREVLSSREPAKIDGVFVEYHWARMILELHDDVAPAARRELAETPVPRLPELITAWARGRK
jgi:hypothetical protein